MYGAFSHLLLTLTSYPFILDFAGTRRRSFREIAEPSEVARRESRRVEQKGFRAATRKKRVYQAKKHSDGEKKNPGETPRFVANSKGLAVERGLSEHAGEHL
jgi:hypothetical protein